MERHGGYTGMGDHGKAIADCTEVQIPIRFNRYASTRAGRMMPALWGWGGPCAGWPNFRPSVLVTLRVTLSLSRSERSAVDAVPSLPAVVYNLLYEHS